MDIEGKLTTFYETGMDGIAMAFEDFENKGFDSLYFMKEGYYLKVFDDGKMIWEGEINEKMAELQSEFFRTGYEDKKWARMFNDELYAKLNLKGLEK